MIIKYYFKILTFVLLWTVTNAQGLETQFQPFYGSNINSTTIPCWPQKWHDSAHSSRTKSTSSPLYSNPSIDWKITDIGLVSIFTSDSDDQAIIDSNNVFYYVRNEVYLRAVFLNQTVKWETTTPGTANFGSNPTLSIMRNIIYIYSSNDIGLFLYAFNAETGDLLWTSPGSKPMPTWVPVGSPIVYSPNGATILCAYSEYGAGASVYFVDGPNQIFPYPYPNFVKWVYTVKGTQVPTVPSVGPDGTIYVALNQFPANQTTLLALNADGELLWSKDFNVRYPLVSMRLIGVRPDNAVMIVHNDNNNIIETILVYNSTYVVYLENARVYAVLSDSRMIIVRPTATNPILELVTSNGVTMWEYQFDHKIDVTGVALDGEDAVYVSTQSFRHSGSVALYGFNILSGKRLWKQPFDGDIIASPSIAPDGSLFVTVSMLPPIASHTLYHIDCCSGHGSCDEYGRCDCNTNWHGDTCSFFCNDTECYANNNLHGRCNSNGECVCDDNFYPIGQCNTYCNNTACFWGKSQHAACTSSGYCACSPNFYGDLCDIYCDDNKNCSGNGKCDLSGNCDCFKGSNFMFWKIGGYSGSDCSNAATPWPLLGFFGVVLVLVICIIVIVFVFFIKRRRFVMYLHTQYEAID